MKAIEQYFPVVLFIMSNKVVLAFESVDEILKCNHSNESYWAVLPCGAVITYEPLLGMRPLPPTQLFLLWLLSYNVISCRDCCEKIGDIQTLPQKSNSRNSRPIPSFLYMVLFAREYKVLAAEPQEISNRLFPNPLAALLLVLVAGSDFGGVSSVGYCNM